MKLTVKVSKRNISLGGHNALDCPVARGFQELGLNVVVTPYSVSCYEGLHILWEAVLPVEEEDRIKAYDASGIMHPHEFELEVPE